MPSPTERLAGLALAVALALSAERTPAQPVGGMDPAVEVGAPDKIDGHGSRPEDAPLDEVGYAGVIAGGAAEGTISAAHRTLPLPSYVEVTALTSGRTILVLVSDRGAQANDRIIDLSCGAARQLGLGGLPAAVRVRRVNPPDQERARLRNGQRAAERMASPEGLLSALRRKLPPAPALVGASDCVLTTAVVAAPPASEAAVPTPAKPLAVKAEDMAAAPASPAPKSPEPTQKLALPHVTAAPSSKGPGYDVQVAAFASRAKASSLAQRIGGRVEAAGTIFRVRKGPYPTEAAARAALPQIRAKGFADARVVTNGGR